MSSAHHTSVLHRLAATLLFAGLLVVSVVDTARAHPLGNFTINHFVRLAVSSEQVDMRFVIDMAEISTLQELQPYDADGDGIFSPTELEAYLARMMPQYLTNLKLNVDDAHLPLQLINRTITTHTGEGGLPLLRITCDLTGLLPSDRVSHHVRFADANHRDRIGWHEAVVVQAAGISIFNTAAYSDGVTNELTAYPKDLTAAPLDERNVDFSFVRGVAPAGAVGLRVRDIKPGSLTSAGDASPAASGGIDGERTGTIAPRDRLTQLIDVPELTLPVALLGLLIAGGLGAAHAFAPGHGKTIVGAYLVGSRGTAGHAAFLGLTVTITHTLGVFALGIVTLFASQYILPERLIPLLSLVSGAIVLVIGLNLFVRRLRTALGYAPHVAHDHAHDEDLHTHSEDGFAIDSGGTSHAHSHGGRMHSHAPPGSDGAPVTWRNLLALGVSGGLVPCPSALVVLLAAVALNRVGYGLLLVVTFSIGLAATLTAIGLVFVYAGRRIKERANGERFQTFARVMPTVSAFVIVCVGAGICFEALTQAGIISLSASLPGELFAGPAAAAGSLSTASVLVFGFGLGLKHAVEADHLAAVSTIVTERKSLLSSSLVGGLWGVGHTISLFVVGIIVILLQVEISERTAQALEFGVAVMLIALGVGALGKLVSNRNDVDRRPHDGSSGAGLHSHSGVRIGKRPLFVGMVHGLAGSAALMLLVLSTISAPMVALLYILIFGVGSIGGMMLMSTLVGVPLHLTANNFAGVNRMMRGLAGLFSICFGLFMVYEIGFVDGLFR